MLAWTGLFPWVRRATRISSRFIIAKIAGISDLELDDGFEPL